jgi:hypothetical protein
MRLFIPAGWDLSVYQQAMKSLREGLDPYAIGQARQIAEHARGHMACTYVYPPLTTVILRLLNHIPTLSGRLLYWTVYAAGFGAQLWALSQLVRPSERKLMRYLLPLAVFFPGLIPNEVILSGNVAIPLYGAVWAGAIRGWKLERWGWFYTAVLTASLFKLPLLTLLAIPILMGAAQWINSVMTAAGGLALFFVQRLIWPVQFSEYLGDIQMQFSLNHDFGRSPAGMFGYAMYSLGRPFETGSIVFYLAYAALIFLVLASFSRMYRREEVEGSTWMTVLLAGTVLLNPRIMAYDALALTIPMMLLVVRAWKAPMARGCLLAGVAATICAYVVRQDGVGDAILMVSVFVAGVYGLLEEARSTSGLAFSEAAGTPGGLYAAQTAEYESQITD